MKIELKGDVICGFPSPGEENREEPLDLNKLLIKHRCTTFCLRAYGLSMSPFILPDDILIVDRALGVHNGDIVIAETDGDFTVKKLCKTDSGFALKPLNPDFKEIEVTNGTRVFGVVTAVVRQTRK